MKRIKVNILEGVSGEWSVCKVVGDSSTIYTDINDGIPTVGRTESYGEYTFLCHNNHKWIMQDTHFEYLEHQPLWDAATGDVLIGGLGLGLVNHELIQNKDITSVTILEKNQEVIDLVWSQCPKDDRFTLVNADVFTWIPPEEAHWDCAWFDTYTGAETLEPEEYNAILREKYSPLCSWIGFWQPIYE